VLFLGAKSKPTPALRWVAGFCALLVWMLGLLAVSPELHATIHADADHADHSCAITLFSHGVEGTNSPVVLIVAPVTLAADLPAAPKIRLAPTPRYLLLPGRAPPLC
jgi:hypothetical protein